MKLICQVVTNVTKWVLAQCRGPSCPGARKLSRCRNIIAGRCACPDASFSRICLGSRSKSKNQDNLSRFFIKKAGNNLPILSVLGKVLLFFKGHKHYYRIIKYCKSFGQFFQLPFFPWEFRNTVFKIIAGYMVFKIICFYPHYHS